MKTLKDTLRMLLCAALGAALFALGYYVGVVFLMMTALVVPMVFVWLRARCGSTWTVIGVIVFGVLVFLMAGINYAGIMMCCTLPIALVVGYIVRRKAPFYYSVLFSCIAMLASLGILFLCIWLFFGVSLVDLLLMRLQAEAEANVVAELFLKIYYYSYQLLISGADTAQTQTDALALAQAAADTPIAKAVEGLNPLVSATVPQAAAFCVPLFGLLNYIIPRAIVKKQGMEVGAVPTFSMWSLPRTFGGWSIALLAIAFIGELAGWRNFDLVYGVAMGFLSVIYSIQGMALIDWALKKRISATAGRVAIIAITYLLFSSLNLYMWIGFFEQIAGLRKRELTKDE